MHNSKFRFLLWGNAIVFAIYLAGHLFDIFIIIPNWKSGSMEELIVFNDFFHKTNPVNYYKVVMYISTALSLICVILYIRAGGTILVLLLISLAIDILIDVVTLHYFTPINEYLFLEQGGVLEPERVREYARQWVMADYLRVALITIGFYTSVRAVHFSYPYR